MSYTEQIREVTNKWTNEIVNWVVKDAKATHPTMTTYDETCLRKQVLYCVTHAINEFSDYELASPATAKAWQDGYVEGSNYQISISQSQPKGEPWTKYKDTLLSLRLPDGSRIECSTTADRDRLIAEHNASIGADRKEGDAQFHHHQTTSNPAPKVQPSGAGQASEQGCYCCRESGCQPGCRCYADAAPKVDSATKRLKEAYENLRQIAIARYCGHCDLHYEEDECTCGSYSLDAAMQNNKQSTASECPECGCDWTIDEHIEGCPMIGKYHGMRKRCWRPLNPRYK